MTFSFSFHRVRDMLLHFWYVGLFFYLTMKSFLNITIFQSIDNFTRSNLAIVHVIIFSGEKKCMVSNSKSLLVCTRFRDLRRDKIWDITFLWKSIKVSKNSIRLVFDKHFLYTKRKYLDKFVNFLKFPKKDVRWCHFFFNEKADTFVNLLTQSVFQDFSKNVWIHQLVFKVVVILLSWQIYISF